MLPDWPDYPLNYLFQYSMDLRVKDRQSTLSELLDGLSSSPGYSESIVGPSPASPLNIENDNSMDSPASPVT